MPFVLLASVDGQHLAHDATENQLRLSEHADDACMWSLDLGDGVVSCALTGLQLRCSLAARPSSPSAAELDANFKAGASGLVAQRLRLSFASDSDHMYEVDGRDVVDGDPQRSLDRAAQRATPKNRTHSRELAPRGIHLLAKSVWTVRDGPERLPSAYLMEMRSRGWTVLDNVMSTSMLANLRANIAAIRAEPNVAEAEAMQKIEQDQRPYRSFDNILGAGSLLAKTPVVAQASMNPVALHLIEAYLQVDCIHYCHSPAITILRPAEKRGNNNRLEPGGWHSDYPFPASCDPSTGTAALVSHTWPEEYVVIVQLVVSLYTFVQSIFPVHAVCFLI
eukprot:COSAG02_NODE_6049_length_3845_cov_1.807528_2_plen_335_part_00